MLELYHVSMAYGREMALDDLNFSVEKGEFVFLTGPSGAGKSTLLRVLAGLERISRGQMFFNGQSLSELSAAQFHHYRQSIGFVFQDYKLLPSRTLFENVAFPLEARGMSSQAVRRRVGNLLEWVGLEHRARVLPARISGGEQQRVAIARALAADPALLLADEPTGNLDPELARETMRLFDDAQARGVTVLVATHDMALLERYDRRVMSLERGRIVRGAAT
jgi:cell division transport system ATP-binding protein